MKDYNTKYLIILMMLVCTMLLTAKYKNIQINKQIIYIEKQKQVIDTLVFSIGESVLRSGTDKETVDTKIKDLKDSINSYINSPFPQSK